MKKIVLLIFIFTLVLTGCASTLPYDNPDTKTITCTVQDKYIKRAHEKDKYMVACEEGEVFTIGDSLINWNFQSTDLYNSFSIDDTIEITEVGPLSFRSPLLSQYRKITDLTVKTEKED